VSSAQLDIPTVFKGAVFKLVFFNYLSIKSSDEPTIKGWPLRAPAAAFRDDGSKDAPPPPPKSHMNKYNSPKRNDLEVEQRGGGASILFHARGPATANGRRSWTRIIQVDYWRYFFLNLFVFPLWCPYIFVIFHFSASYFVGIKRKSFSHWLHLNYGALNSTHSHSPSKTVRYANNTTKSQNIFQCTGQHTA